MGQALWRHRDFLKLWAGQSISEIGSRITRDGLPLAAVLLLGATPAQMGALSAAGSAAVLVAGPLAGVWVDRLRRRPVLIACDLLRAALLATIPLAALQQRLTLGHLFAAAALASLFTVFFDVAWQAYLPALVEREHVLEGNSKLGMTSATAEIIGPGLTGILVQTITAPIAILFDAISFAVSAASLALIRKPESRPEAAVHPHAVRELREGWEAVRANPYLRAFALRAAICGTAGGAFSLYYLYAVRELGLTPALLGLCIALGGVGNLLGASFAQRIARRIGLGRTLIWSSALLGLLALFIPLARPPVAFATFCLMASQLFGDFAGVIFYVTELSFRQMVTPDRVLGRVNSVMQLAFRGTWLIGALASGVLAQRFGMRAAFLGAALGFLAGTIPLALSPVRGLERAPLAAATGKALATNGHQ